MKLSQIFAAGLLLVGVGLSTGATAQPGPPPHARGPGRDHAPPPPPRPDRGPAADHHRRDDHRWDRHDRGRHYGWRNDHRRDCRTVWRHGQRQRVCW